MRAILFFLSFSILVTGCVSVAVNSSNRDTKNRDKITKLFLAAECNGKNNVYYQHVLRHLSLDLKLHSVESDTFVLRSTTSGDSMKIMQDRITKFNPSHVLTVKQQTQENRFDESHVDENIVLNVSIKRFNSKDFIWQTIITVNSGGILGFGTVGSGNGGKITAQRIITQMENDAIIAKLAAKS